MCFTIGAPKKGTWLWAGGAEDGSFEEKISELHI